MEKGWKNGGGGGGRVIEGERMEERGRGSKKKVEEGGWSNRWRGGGIERERAYHMQY